MDTQLTTVQADGLELSLFPWEDAALYVADVEAMLEEIYAKPWLLDEDMDASVNDPMYDRYLAESRLPVAEPVEATRFWSGEPVLCNWSFLDGATLDEDADWTEEELPFCESRSTLAAELAYYETTLPF